MAVVGYAYFSRVESNYTPPLGHGDWWPADVNVYAVLDSGALLSDGSATYRTAAADYLGYRFGFYPGIYPEGNPARELTPPEKLRISVPPEEPRSVRLAPVSGASILDNIDLGNTLPGPVVVGSIDPGTNYIAAYEWEEPDEFGIFPYPNTLIFVIAVSGAQWAGIATTSDLDRVYATTDAGGGAPETSAFWTSLVGTKEKP